MIGLDIDGTLLDYGQECPPKINQILIAQLPPGEPVALISNQGGIPFALAGIERKGSPVPYPTPLRFAARLLCLLEALRAENVQVASVLVCVYHPSAQPVYIEMAFESVAKLLGGVRAVNVTAISTWRKPSPDMLILAGVTEFWGDSSEDEEAARAAGVPFVKVARFPVVVIGAHP